MEIQNRFCCQINYTGGFLISHLCLVFLFPKELSVCLSIRLLSFSRLLSSLLHASKNRCYLSYITSPSTHILSHVIFFHLLCLPSLTPLPPFFSSTLYPSVTDQTRDRPARLVHCGSRCLGVRSSAIRGAEGAWRM